jgi:transcription antitermination factor NusG
MDCNMPDVTIGRVECAQWYALVVKARQEPRVSGVLESKGYELFLPTRMRSGKEPVRALFPGYLFCRIDASRRLPILITPGVIGFVGSGKVPEPVSQDEIDAIQSIVRSGQRRESVPLLTAGERVRVVHGALRGLEGILVDQRGRCRVVVSIALLQRSVAVDIERECVEAVKCHRGIA